MINMASPVREQIYGAVRAFTCATVAEAERATAAIIRLVDSALPADLERDVDTNPPHLDADGEDSSHEDEHDCGEDVCVCAQ